MEIALLVVGTASKLKKVAARLFREHNLSPAQFNVLHLLSSRPEGMRAGDLASELLVDPSNITGLLRRLSLDGFVEDHASPKDGRSRVVRLTSKGRSRWRKAEKAFARELALFEALLSPTERLNAEKALTKIARRCDESVR
jgi:DNA-binding MarR family transcriptional regulator